MGHPLRTPEVEAMLERFKLVHLNLVILGLLRLKPILRK